MFYEHSTLNQFRENAAVKSHTVKHFTLNEWRALHFSLDLRPAFFAMLIQGHHKSPLMRWSSSLHVPKKAPSRCLSAPHPCISFNVVRNEEHWRTLMFKVCPSVAVGWRKCHFKYERSWREAAHIFWRARYSFSNYAKRLLCKCCSLCRAFVLVSKKKRANYFCYAPSCLRSKWIRSVQGN